MIRIAVLISGGGTNLQAIIDAQKNGIIKTGSVELVISNNANAFGLVRASKAGIKTEIVSKKEFLNSCDFDAKLVEILRENKIDLVCLAGFMCVLGESFTDAYNMRILNIHPSLIPSFCGVGMYGLHVHEAALLRGVKISGATVHFVNCECDGGPIIAQKAVAVDDFDTPETLQRKIMENCEWIIYPDSIEKVCKQIENGEI